MGDEVFDQKILTEKLSKLNSSQQSIESLSKLCVPHRKKARQVVQTWEKVFKSAQQAQQVALLYLANDILQNSRREGSEFVNEFWKVLPSALKVVYDSGDKDSRHVVLRLVRIWEERKVFGSRSQNLKNDIVGKNPSPVENLPPLVNNGKKPNPIKVVKRDAIALRIKLAVGCLPEKILTSFQSAHDEIATEEGAFTRCKKAVASIQELEKDILVALSQGNLLGSDVVGDLKKQEDKLQQCVDQLENSEAIRAALVSQLKEAIEDQESRLEVIRSELLAARGQVKQAADIRLQLTSTFSAPPPAITQSIAIPAFPPPLSNNPTPEAAPTTNPSTSFLTSVTEDVNTNASAAAAMAAKLAASASSAHLLTDIFSRFVAEEEASKSSGGLKRQKLDTPNSEGGSSAYLPTMQPPMTTLPLGSTNQLQVPFIPPPPALLPPGSSPLNQLAVPYGYGGNNLQPPLVIPGPPAQQPQGQVQQQQQQVQQANGGYYRPLGVGFYGQAQQQATPPIHRP